MSVTTQMANSSIAAIHHDRRRPPLSAADHHCQLPTTIVGLVHQILLCPVDAWHHMCCTFQSTSDFLTVHLFVCVTAQTFAMCRVRENFNISTAACSARVS
jgi:hypothetical protein